MLRNGAKNSEPPQWPPLERAEDVASVEEMEPDSESSAISVGWIGDGSPVIPPT